MHIFGFHFNGFHIFTASERSVGYADNRGGNGHLGKRLTVFKCALTDFSKTVRQFNRGKIYATVKYQVINLCYIVRDNNFF